MEHKNRYKLKEWEELSDSEKATVLAEYKKGWHFLLIWGAVFIAFIIGGLSYLTELYFRDYQGYKRFLGILVITYIISKLSSLFWEVSGNWCFLTFLFYDLFISP